MIELPFILDDEDIGGLRSFRESLVRADCIDLGILHFFDYLERNTGADNPYHNTQHCIDVAFRAMNLCTIAVQDFSDQDRRHLMVAALFHDFDYVVGYSEQHNLGRACDAALSAIQCFEDLDSIPINFSAIQSLIVKTAWPRIENTPIGLLSSVLMDADILAVADPDWYSTIFGGLRSEVGLDIPQMVEAQIKFHDTLKLHSDAGKALWRTIRSKKNSELLEYKNSLAH